MKINLDNLKNKNKMKNVILTCLLTFTVISFSFGQLKVIAPDGNVGVGTSNPAVKFQVDGITRIVPGAVKPNAAILRIGTGRATDGNAFIDLYPTTATTGNDWQGRFLSNAAGLTNFSHKGNAQFVLRTYNANAPIIFTPNNVPRMYLATDGNVGIGTSSPTASLHVEGTAVKTGGGMWGTASSALLKTDVENYNRGIEDLMKIRPVTYRYNGKAGIADTKTVHTGVIAEEFSKVAPEATFKYKYTEVENAESSELALKKGATTEYMGIDPSQITYMLVNAVKEQQEVIKNLQSQVEEMSKVGFTAPAASDHVHYSTVILNGQDEKAMLAQNAPNPFTKNTKIDYFVPSNSRSASMSFTDITGKEVKRINIDHTGLGTLDVSIADMPIGIYSYSLVIDGSTIASMKMVLSK